MMSIGLEASHGLERPRLAWSVNMQKRLSTRGKGNCGAAWGRLARRIANSPNIELIGCMPRVAVELLEIDFQICSRPARKNKENLWGPRSSA